MANKHARATRAHRAKRTCWSFSRRVVAARRATFELIVRVRRLRCVSASRSIVKPRGMAWPRCAVMRLRCYSVSFEVDSFASDLESACIAVSIVAGRSLSHAIGRPDGARIGEFFKSSERRRRRFFDAFLSHIHGVVELLAQGENE